MRKCKITNALHRNKEEIFKLLKNDYNSAFPSFIEKNRRIRRWRRIYEDIETNGNGGSLKSTYRSREFKKKLRELVPNIAEPILESERLFDVDITSDDGYSDSETVVSDILNYQFRSIPKFNHFINSLAKTFAIDGTSTVKATWSRDVNKIVTGHKEEMVFSKDKKELTDFIGKMHKDKQKALMVVPIDVLMKKVPIDKKSVEITVSKVTKNRPNIREIENLRIMTDPNARGKFEDSRFLIEAISTDMSTLESNDRYFNLDKLKNSMESRDYRFDGSLYAELYLDGSTEYVDELILNDTFSFSDSARKRIDVLEYWGEVPIDGDGGETVPIVASWVGDVLIRLEKNPMPHKSIPYCIQAYEPIKGSIFGESDAEIVAEDQIGMTLATRSMQDITYRNQKNTSQEFIENGFLPGITEKNNYKNGKTVFYRKGSDPSRAIFRRTVDEVPQVLFDMKNMYKQEIEQSIGSVSAISDNTGDKSDGVDNRTHNIVGRFSELFRDVGYLMVQMNRRFSLDTDIYKVNKEIKKVNKGMLSSINEISVNVKTAAKNNKKISSIIGLMNTRAGNMSEDVSSIHYAKIAELSGMSDLSHEVLKLTLNKEPTEAEKQQQQMEMMRIQLELEKIKLEIKKIDSDASLNMAMAQEHNARAIEKQKLIEFGLPASEASLNRAKAIEHIAGSEKLEAQTELFNQQFSLEDSGEKRRREETDKEYSHAANLEREQVRTDRELTMLEKKKDANHDGVVTKQESDDFLDEYIKDGTLNNDSYDAVGDVYRNILYKGQYDNPVVDKEKIRNGKDI